MPERKWNSRGILARWSRVSLRAKGVAVLSIPLAALFIVFIAIYWVEGDVRNADLMVVHFYDTRAELLLLRSSLLDAETAAGGYLATGEEYFLSTFYVARQSVEKSRNRLSTIFHNDPAYSTSLRRIDRLAADEIRILDELKDHAPAGSRTALAERGKTVMSNVQALVTLLSDEEERRFFQARYDRDLMRQRLFRTVVFCGILGPFGTLFVHLLIAGRLVRRIQGVGENARRLAHGLPLQPLPASDDEISDLAHQLDDTANQLRERERKLRESERRYRDLFDQAPIPYEETDRDGVIRRFNQAVCTLLKWRPDQILGRHAWDFLAPEEKDALREALLNRIRSGSETVPFECQYVLEDGSQIAVEIRENLIRDDRGEVTGVRRSVLDITERKLAELAARKVEEYALELRNRNEQLAHALEAARSATEAKSRFLASVSHELRTPLNGIIGFSELMQDAKLGPVSEEQRESLGDILTSARHLLQLINDILDISKVEAGKMEFRPEPVEVGALLSEVRDVIRPLADKKNIRISTDIPSGLTAVLDAGRFKQVLYNYLSNAVKFTPPGGKVQARIVLDGHAGFRLEVEDTGIGIEADEIPRLFQEFQQLSGSRKSEQGTGLGLALTRHIVEAQGGTVSVLSTPGKGSIFSAVLPRYPIAAAHSASA